VEWIGEMNSDNAIDISRADRECAERLKLARKIYRALAAQDPNRLIVLHDGRGKVLAKHDPEPERTDPDLTS
jgi:hypothetical protein